MRNDLLLQGLSVIALLAAGCGGEPSAGTVTPAEADAVTAVAKPVVDDLMKTLSGRLMEAMTAGGPAAGIEICAGEAQQLTRIVEARHEVTRLDRVGTRVRNPVNAPGPADAEALDYFAARHAANGEWPDRYIRAGEGDRTYTYYRPIVVGTACLTCHGAEATIPQAVREVLAERYPGDAATGYAEGDLRGAFAVGVRLD